MLKALLILLNLYVSSFAFAQDLFPQSLVIMGRGIQNNQNDEVILIACVGKTTGNETANCNEQRLVSLKKGTPTWLGQTFPALNNIQVKQSLLKWYSEQQIEDIFAFFSKDEIYTFAFTDKNGWNWANSPLTLDNDKFKRVTAYFLLYSAILENARANDPIQAPVQTKVVAQNQEEVDGLVKYINELNTANNRKTLEQKVQHEAEVKAQAKIEAKADELYPHQKKLLKCLSKIIEGNYGGYDAPKVVRKILENVANLPGLSKDPLDLDHANEACEEAIHSLHKISQHQLDLTELGEAYHPSNEDANYITTFMDAIKFPTVKCHTSDVSAIAGFLVGVKAGLEWVTCDYSNGQTRHYLGALLDFTLGTFAIGADVNKSSDQQNLDIGLRSHAGKLAYFDAQADDSFDGEEVLLVAGRIYTKEEKNGYRLNSVGIGYNADSKVGVSSAFRVFNGKRNWHQLIDILHGN